jgi:hypothetical protein
MISSGLVGDEIGVYRRWNLELQKANNSVGIYFYFYILRARMIVSIELGRNNPSRPSTSTVATSALRGKLSVVVELLQQKPGTASNGRSRSTHIPRFFATCGCAPLHHLWREGLACKPSKMGKLESWSAIWKNVFARNPSDRCPVKLYHKSGLSQCSFRTWSGVARYPSVAGVLTITHYLLFSGLAVWNLELKLDLR